MMPHITEQEKKMMEEIDKWLCLGDDGWYHLKEDAPIEIKINHEKIKQLYKEL